MIAELSAAWLCLLATLASLVRPEGLLQQAERAYHEGRFAQANELWLVALQDPQLDRAAISFDLGSCAFRMGQVPEAILWWHRALHLAPGDAQATFNLRRAEQELGLPPAAGSWRDALAPGELLLLVVGVQTAGLLGCVLLRRRGLRLAAGALLLATLPAVAEVVAPEPERFAIVLGRSAVLRAEPHAEVPRLALLAAGTRVRVVAASDRWVGAETPSGRGWVERSQVGLIE